MAAVDSDTLNEIRVCGAGNLIRFNKGEGGNRRTGGINAPLQKAKKDSWAKLLRDDCVWHRQSRDDGHLKVSATKKAKKGTMYRGLRREPLQKADEEPSVVDPFFRGMV